MKRLQIEQFELNSNKAQRMSLLNSVQSLNVNAQRTNRRIKVRILGKDEDSIEPMKRKSAGSVLDKCQAAESKRWHRS